jgi:hypothetical protein
VDVTDDRKWLAQRYEDRRPHLRAVALRRRGFFGEADDPEALAKVDSLQNRHSSRVTCGEANGRLDPMFASARHRAAEARFLSLVEDASLPRPDRLEFGRDTVTFYWDESKTAVIVDLDDVAPTDVRRARPQPRWPGHWYH